MRTVGDVVDVHKSGEDADPWVLALALHIKAEGKAVCIVTEDIVDRQSISIATASDRLVIAHCRVRIFFEHYGIAVLKEKDKAES
ncbi:MAG: hypothetical protein OXE04_03705 [bacterium]|nr:hypothetical protein [bacterium]